MRNLNPSDIDKMVAVRGMVTRCSAVIPDLKMAFFKCLVRGAPRAHLRRSRPRERAPLRCTGCQNLGTMTLIHNRCVFANKQQIKMQETPDAIPEGETPHTVSMCVFDSLVDEAKPGDRVEITGVYRAVPIRSAPTQRVLKSVYKTYIDVIHIRKDRSARIKNTAARDDREDQAAYEAEGVARPALVGATRSGRVRVRSVAPRVRRRRWSSPPNASPSSRRSANARTCTSVGVISRAVHLGDGGGEARALVPAVRRDAQDVQRVVG